MHHSHDHYGTDFVLHRGEDETDERPRGKKSTSEEYAAETGMDAVMHSKNLGTGSEAQVLSAGGPRARGPKPQVLNVRSS